MDKNFLKNRRFLEIPLQDVNWKDAPSDFSYPTESEALPSSIREVGLLQPVYLTPSRERENSFSPLCGHRRLRAVARLGWDSIPAFVLEEGPPSPSEALLFNVAENRLHRSLNAMEKSNVLAKVTGFHIEESIIIGSVMPLLDLERSKKIFEDCLSLQDLIPEFREYLVRINASLGVGAILARWEAGDQEALFRLILHFNPGGNKLRELIELIEEMALREGLPPAAILQAEALLSLCREEELAPSDKGRKIWEHLYKKRFPYLSGKKEALQKEIRSLGIPKGATLGFPENFEEEALTLHLRFSGPAELQSRLKEIQTRWGEDKLEGIFRLLRE